MKKFTKEGFKEFCDGFTGRSYYEMAEEYAATLKDEPMSVEEIVKILRAAGIGSKSRDGHELEDLARTVQPLTVQQGFVPDWEGAPDTAVGHLSFFTCMEFMTINTHALLSSVTLPGYRVEFSPRPVTEKTDDELRKSAIEALSVNENDRESLLKICEILGRKVTK